MIPPATDMSPLSFLLFLSVLSSHLSPVRALECYDCNSFVDKDCYQTNKLILFKRACPEEAVGCRKIDITVRHQGINLDRIIRQCAMSMDTFGCQQVYGTNGKLFKRTACECRDDFCNSAPAVKSPPLLIRFILIICVYFIVV